MYRFVLSLFFRASWRFAIPSGKICNFQPQIAPQSKLPYQENHPNFTLILLLVTIKSLHFILRALCLAQVWRELSPCWPPLLTIYWVLLVRSGWLALTTRPPLLWLLALTETLHYWPAGHSAAPRTLHSTDSMKQVKHSYCTQYRHSFSELIGNWKLNVVILSLSTICTFMQPGLRVGRL